ncbi:MAG: hypothetical protein JNM91_14350 [Flavobacteriales bacterium]|nr:hypothetical protein [Flavobacteriales bacterium]
MNTKITVVAAFWLVASACTKEELSGTASAGNTKALSPCPMQTVPWQDLANPGNCTSSYNTNTSQQLNAVYKYCYARVKCKQTSNVVSGSFIGNVNVEMESFFPDPNAVTYLQQRQVIDHFMAMAQAAAPTCPLTGTPMVVTHLCFENDILVDLFINCYASYACCSNALPS